MFALQEACAGPESLSLGGRVELWDAATFAATLSSAPNPGEWFLNINTPEEWQQAQEFGPK